VERDALIYDVGMHNGNDTAFYLARGFRVVAVEADPTLAAAGAQRFRDAVAKGRLSILNVAISEHSGEATFWICDQNSEWNSFDETVAGRDGAPHHPIQVPTKTFASIVAEYDDPHYVKIDIEGHDVQCLRDLGTLSPRRLPKYVSWESDPAPDHGRSAEVSPLLRLANQVGFSRFKLIDQATYWPLPTALSLGKIADVVVWRLLRAANRPPLRPVRPLIRKLTKRAQLGQQYGWEFAMGASGPWGDEMPGKWLTFAEAVDAHRLATREHFASNNRADHTFWCDWHAAS